MEWLTAAENAGVVSAWGFLVGALGLPFTLAGLYLTFLQAKRARLSAEQVRSEVDKFKVRYDRSEAIAYLADAKAGMENTSILILKESWREAGSIYDEARKSIQKVRFLSELSPSARRKLKLIVEHLESFSNEVDNALHGKGDFPDSPSVRSAIRRNTDDLTLVQRELNEGMA